MQPVRELLAKEHRINWAGIGDGMHVIATLWMVAFCAFLAATGAKANDAAYDGAVVFRSTVAENSTLDIELSDWNDDRRRFVSAMIDDMLARAPGLFARATQAGPLNIYLTTTETPSHPAAAWARRRHENSLIVRHDFFRTGHPNRFGVDYTHWLFVHEIAHLADPVDRIGQSPAWSDAIVPVIANIEADLAAQNMNLRQAMFAFRDEPAIARGLPSVYAAISIHEALAELTAAVYFDIDLDIAPAPRAVLLEHQFALPTQTDSALTDHYRRAYRAYRDGRFDDASAILSEAIDLDPTFGMGHYLLGYTHLQMGEARLAYADWQRSLRLFGDIDPLLASEVASSIETIRQSLGK